jgi:hypothetical protein
MPREAKYPAQISALVPQEIRDRIDALEEANPLSGGDIIREALAEGLTSVERRIAEAKHALACAVIHGPRDRGVLVAGRDLEEVSLMTDEDAAAYVAAGGEL